MALTQNANAIASYDNAPFFEKVLRYAVQTHIIDQERITEIIDDAATGSLQIAEYFGESTHLRKSLETSMQRMVSLVSLYLEDVTDAELDAAAQLLKEKPFRSLSRGGSQMLKALYSLPEDEHFGSPRMDTERDFLKKCLSKVLSVAKYRQTISDCERYKRNITLATLLVKKLGASITELNDMHASSQHVIRTSLLSLAYGAKKVAANKSKFPDEAALFDIFSSIRKEWALLGDVTYASKFMDDVPTEYQAYAKELLVSIQKEDLPLIADQSQALEVVHNKLKNSKYFYLHNPLNSLSIFDKTVAADWFKLTGDNDDASLLTLFLCTAAGVDRKSTLKVFEAKKAASNIRDNGLLQNEVLNLIKTAPHDDVEQLTSLWNDFVDEASPFLFDSSDEKLLEAMMYLEERCNIQKAKK